MREREDLAYLKARANAERRAADGAADPAAAAVHRELAQCYEHRMKRATAARGDRS